MLITEASTELELGDKRWTGKYRVYSRGGSSSPLLYIINYQDRWLAPYACRRIELRITLACMFKMFYEEVDLKALIPTWGVCFTK